MTRWSHKLVRAAAKEQNEVTGGISLVSNSIWRHIQQQTCNAAVAAEQPVRSCWTRWYFEFHLVGRVCSTEKKKKHQKLTVEQQLTIRELWKEQFLWSVSTNNRPVWRVLFTLQKRGSQAVLFLFSHVGSCSPASQLRFQPFARIYIIFFFFEKAHEHCHLVAISEVSREFRQVKERR